MGAGSGAIPGEGFVGSVSACSRFGSKPALPLLPVRFLAHPAEKARIGPNSLAVPDFTLLVVFTPCGAWQIRAQGTGTAASLVYFSLHSGVCGSQGTATQRQPYVAADITGSS